MQNSKRASTKCLSMVHEYEKYVNLSTQWNRWLLKPMGAWPLLPNISRAEKCFNWQINAVCYGLISFLFIPCGLYVMLEVEDLYSKIKLFGPLIFCVMAYLKYYSLIFHGNDIRECLDRIEWDWKNVKHLEDRDIMVATANFGRRFLALIEKAMSEISLIEVSGCTLDMCLVGYYIIVEWNSKDMTATVTYTIILASLTFNIFIFCYIGELVAEQCKMVGERSYMIEWHRLPGKKRLSLVLIIAMSNATIKLTAGNLIKLSLDSFSSVIKTSVAFLNMLRTLT
ncbi:uncharacterized protein LOC128873460 isoform X3 [Hylaeus volcanicus]|uniref:uncharacterized protein LOC128873460 isoform X3 n=1 Tax=Hylaeus volcanicus TaxID=313075 RepID=UPI0023B7AD6B|nr:uncharacterized protein LOC128873460 isoform X3 [Hylaeus volcanicus]